MANEKTNYVEKCNCDNMDRKDNAATLVAACGIPAGFALFGYGAYKGLVEHDYVAMGVSATAGLSIAFGSWAAAGIIADVKGKPYGD